MKGLLSLLSIILFLILMMLPQAQANTTELAICGIQGSQNHKMAFTILQEVYSNLGVHITELPMPSKRSLVTSSTGKLCSGEMQRIAKIEVLYPTLKKVPEHILVLESHAFVIDHNIQINNLQDLGKYVVGVPGGIVNLEKLTEGMNRVLVKDHTQLFKLLEAKRVDVIIASKTYWDNYTSKNSNTSIKMVIQPLAVKKLYHFIHESRSDLIDDIDIALKNMKKSGRYSEILNSFQ